ncbi:MAG TPA: hypothetical protein VKR52_17660 [Terracidiphilus sp.]|nr:hypothetical protein [Terracidiphilus sp.]
MLKHLFQKARIEKGLLAAFRHPQFVGMDVAGETRCNKEIAPIPVGQSNRIAQSPDFTSAQLENGKSESLKLELIKILERGKVASTVVKQDFAHEFALIRGEKQLDPAFRAWT